MTIAVLSLRGGLRANNPLRRPLSGQPNPLIRRRNATNSTPDKGRSDPATTQGTGIPVPAILPSLPLWQRLGPLSRFFEAYGRSQRKRPLTTQFISSLIIYFCGDQCAQSINGEPYDPKRTVKALMIGAGSSIPSYKWFTFLAVNFNYPSKLLSLITKVTVNQIVFTPLFNSYFFGMQALLSGYNFEQIVEHIKRTVPVSFVNSCKLWPAVTAFSFTFVSQEYRSIFAGVIAIGWQTYLSFLNRKAENEEHAAAEKEEGVPARALMEQER